MEWFDIVRSRRGKLADCPGVRRLRNRRLLVYLWIHGFEKAFGSIKEETDLFMNGPHLRLLVAGGQWNEAIKYTVRFLPLSVSVEARVLLFFLHTLWTLDNLNACSKGLVLQDYVYLHHVNILKSLCTHNAKLRAIARGMLYSPQLRASLDWKLVRETASWIAYGLAHEGPELRRKLLLPIDPETPNKWLPIHPCRPRRRSMKLARRPTPSALAKCYLKQKRCLPFSSGPHYDLSDEGLNRVADLIVRCLKAGKLPELHQEHPLQSSAKEGASGTPFKFIISTDPAKNIGTSSVTNAGASVSQPAKTSGISSATNAAPMKHLSEDGWYTNSAGKSFGREKNPSAELTTIEEDDSDKRRRRLNWSW